MPRAVEGAPVLPRESPAILAPDRLAGCFEGLGDRCEFGIVQQFCGAGPVGLLRFASMPHAALLELLATGFSALDDPSQVSVRLRPGEDEWWGCIDAFGIEYHTSCRQQDAGEADILARERRRIPFLKRKLLEQLRDPDKLFLRRDAGRPVAEMDDLFAAMQRYGRNQLLWVDQTERPELIGGIELLRPGHLRGCLGHHWPNAAPSPGGLGIWLTLLSGALAACRPDQWWALCRNGGACPGEAKVLAQAGWYSPHGAFAELARGMPPVEASAPVLTHATRPGPAADDSVVLRCELVTLGRDRLYTASAWVWVPEDFAGWIGLVPDLPWVRMWEADMSVRNSWQRIATSFRTPETKAAHSCCLVAAGAVRQAFYSTCWRLDRGVVPKDCFPP